MGGYIGRMSREEFDKMVAPKAEPMATRHGWNVETRGCLYQLWPPGASKTEPHYWSAAWTERREHHDNYSYLDDYDDGWRPACDFGRGDSADEALRCFPSSNEAEQAKRALLDAALGVGGSGTGKPLTHDPFAAECEPGPDVSEDLGVPPDSRPLSDIARLERDRAECHRLHKEAEAEVARSSRAISGLLAELADIAQQRDQAQAEIERLRERVRVLEDAHAVITEIVEAKAEAERWKREAQHLSEGPWA